MSTHIRTARDDGMLTLTLNRPDKRNAITDEMYESLASELEAAQGDDGVRVVLIRGEGPFFTAGNDLSDFAAVDTSGQGPRNVWRFIRSLAANRKPLVAAAQGRAVGIGTTMLLHCDHVVLAEDAVLTTPFVNLALVPEAASSLLLPARIGHVRAFSMLALGEPLSAREALTLGLANKVVPLADLADTARDFARRLSRQPLDAVIATKLLMREVTAMESRMERERQEFVARLGTPDAREAFAAFAERREPRFLS